MVGVWSAGVVSLGSTEFHAAPFIVATPSTEQHAEHLQTNSASSRISRLVTTARCLCVRLFLGSVPMKTELELELKPELWKTSAVS
jgi:hypothetical protein